MFSKKDKLESFLGTNTQVDGEISVKGTLRLDGRVNGNVNADWLVLGEGGFIKGEVKANGIIVGGQIEGNLIAKEVVDIKHKGSITGDISTTKLAVSEGGIIDGRVSMRREASNIIELKQEKAKAN